jgi:hypothetical protein
MQKTACCIALDVESGAIFTSWNIRSLACHLPARRLSASTVAITISAKTWRMRGVCSGERGCKKLLVASLLMLRAALNLLYFSLDYGTFAPCDGGGGTRSAPVPWR